MPMDDALITLAHIIDPEDPGVAALVDDVESRLGPIEVFVFNIGANVPSSILDETPRSEPT